MKNICLIMPNVFPVPAVKGGATESLITNLLEKNEIEKKINFTCISVYDEKAEIESKKFKYTEFIYIKNERKSNNEIDLTFTTLDIYFKNYMDQIYEKIKNREFDYIIIEGGDITGYEYLLKHFPKEKCLVHIHGNVLGDNKKNLEIYNYFIAISKFTKELIMRDKIVPENRIKLLYNAINLDDFKKEISAEEKEVLRKKYGIDKDDNVIIFFGRTIEPKGVRELMKAFKQMKNIDKSKLLIVGNSNYSAEVKTEYDLELEELSKGIEDKIKFTGYVNNKELYKIHNIADIAVIPSLWEELFGLVVVEAMESKLPLIITNRGGMPEIVNKKCSFIVEKDENLVLNISKYLDYLVEHPEKRKEMGEEGRKRAELFGMDEYYKNFLNLINE